MLEHVDGGVGFTLNMYAPPPPTHTHFKINCLCLRGSKFCTRPSDALFVFFSCPACALVCTCASAAEQEGNTADFVGFASAIGLINTHSRVDNIVAESRSP